MNNFYKNGKPRGISFTKANGKRPDCIQIAEGNRRTSVSISGNTDIHEAWEKVVTIAKEWRNLTDAEENSLRAYLPKFLEDYNLEIQLVVIATVREKGN